MKNKSKIKYFLKVNIAIYVALIVILPSSAMITGVKDKADKTNPILNSESTLYTIPLDYDEQIKDVENIKPSVLTTDKINKIANDVLLDNLETLIITEEDGEKADSTQLGEIGFSGLESAITMREVRKNKNTFRSIEKDSGREVDWLISWRVLYSNEDETADLPVKYARVRLYRQGAGGYEETFSDAAGYCTFIVDPDPDEYRLYIYVDAHSASYHDAVYITECSGSSTYHGITDWITVDGSTSIESKFTGSDRGVWSIYHDIIDEYVWLAARTGGPARSKIQVRWPCNTYLGFPTTSSFFYPAIFGDPEYIQITNAATWSRETHLHEYGHAIMFTAYGSTFANWPLDWDAILHFLEEGGVHYPDSEISMAWAIAEGWAEFMQCAVDNDPSMILWGDGLESTVWADSTEHGGDLGDWDGYNVEGAFASILWDIFDGTDSSDYPDYSFSEYGDYISNRFDRIWAIMLDHRPQTLTEFWNDWYSEYGVDENIWAIFYNQRVKKDVLPPINVESYTSNPPLGPTDDNTIYVNWADAIDVLSGVYGYGLYWSHSPNEPSQDVDVYSSYTTSDPLAVGTWYLNIKPVDRAENWGDTWSIGPWHVSTPSDTTPPQTYIDSGPSGTIGYDDVTFTWHGSDDVTSPGDLDYSYKLEGYSSSWSSWTSSTSKNYYNLNDGSYSFMVKAKDEADNEDPTPTARGFTVDVTEDTYHISGWIVGDGKDGVTISFTIDDISYGSTTTDTDGDYYKDDFPDGTYTATPLKSGYYFFPSAREAVIDGDDANNINFDIHSGSDITPPETYIDSGPSGAINFNDVYFTWHGEDDETLEELLQYSYKLEGPSGDDDWSGWTYYVGDVYHDLSNGEYIFFVRARDQAGNVDPTPATRTFTVNVQLIYYSIMCEWVTGCGDYGPSMSQFDIGNEIVAYSQWINTEVGGRIRWDWTTTDNGQVRHSYELIIAMTSDCYWSSWTPDLGGNWRVDIYYDDVYLASGPEFEVIDGPPMLLLNRNCEWVNGCGDYGPAQQVFNFGDEVYSYTEIRYTSLGDRIRWDWISLDYGQVRYTEEWIITESQTTICCWSNWIPDLNGDWQISIYYNNVYFSSGLVFSIPSTGDPQGEIISYIVDPTTIEPGENVNITIIGENIGDGTGEFLFMLWTEQHGSYVLPWTPIGPGFTIEFNHVFENITEDTSCQATMYYFNGENITLHDSQFILIDAADYVIGEIDFGQSQFFVGPFTPEEYVPVAEVNVVNNGNSYGTVFIRLYEHPDTPDENILSEISFSLTQGSSYLTYLWTYIPSLPDGTWPLGVKVWGETESEPDWETPDTTHQWDVQIDLSSIPVVNLDTSEVFFTIQQAIDDPDTINGHTIFVSNGNYFENVVIHKTITLIGGDKNTTIINGSESGFVVNISADWVNISGFTIKNSGYYPYAGLKIISNHNTITGNNIIDNNYYGILQEGSDGNNITRNTITGNLGSGISVSYSNYTTIYKNTIADTNGGDGIDVSTSNYIIIIGNNISNNFAYGIRLHENSNNSIITSNIITHNQYTGLSIYDYSDGNNITENTITDNQDHGIKHEDSSNNNISTNIITNNKEYGIILSESSQNTINRNNIINNKEGILLQYSESNIISGNELTNNNRNGIYLYSYSESNNITENNITNNNHNGIYILLFSNDNVISKNNIQNNNYSGIYMNFDSDGNTISKNNIQNNNYSGIYLDCSYSYSCDNNIIQENDIVENNLGMNLSGMSNNNHIYHNNFINNTKNACDTGTDNIWDDGYPSGGNYWSDYNGLDVFLGPGQNISGIDGIGDTPYTISGGMNQDSYPLMYQWENNQPIYSITDLGTLGEGIESKALAINNIGQTVGYSFIGPPAPYPEERFHAFLWENEVMTDIGTLQSDNADNSIAQNINDNGLVVGTSNFDGGGFWQKHAFIYDNGEMVDLGTLGGSTSCASGINNVGQVVGWAYNETNRIHTALWEYNPAMDTWVINDLGMLPGYTSFARRINNIGQIVGYARINTQILHAVIYIDDVWVDLNDLIPADSGWDYLIAAADINDAGQIIGSGILENGEIDEKHAFLLTPNPGNPYIITDLGALPGGSRSGARSLNDADPVQIVGSSTDANGDSRAILWEFNGDTWEINDLNDLYENPEMALTYASDINDNDHIIGSGVIDDQTHAFFLTL